MVTDAKAAKSLPGVFAVADFLEQTGHSEQAPRWREIAEMWRALGKMTEFSRDTAARSSLVSAGARARWKACSAADRAGVPWSMSSFHAPQRVNVAGGVAAVPSGPVPMAVWPAGTP